MVKHGPCHHCGVTSTPLWRNGPPDKPVLCNACGSRWRTKGSLENYTPMHTRDFLGPEEVTISKIKPLGFKDNKLQNKKHNNGELKHEYETQTVYTNQNFRKVLKEDTCNHSSSGSAISCSETNACFSYTDATNFTVPSKKSTSCITWRKPSAVEKLARDLYSILQEQQASYLSGSFEEDLLYGSETLQGSIEIGSGSVLIRSQNTVKEESEATSFSLDNTAHTVNNHGQGSASGSVQSESKVESSVTASTEQDQKLVPQMVQDSIKRYKISHMKPNILQARNSWLCSLDLTDVVSYDKFMNHLTHEEQKQLFKLLPSVDISVPPESLRNMFNSLQFQKNITYLQQLLLAGVFDLSFLKSSSDECRALRKRVLTNLNQTKWVESYCQLKEDNLKNIVVGKEATSGLNSLRVPKLISSKRPFTSQNQLSETRASSRSPKRVAKSNDTSLQSERAPQLMYSDENLSYNGAGAIFCQNDLSGIPPDRSSILDSRQWPNSDSNQDASLDVSSNSIHPKAELLHPIWKQSVPISSLVENAIEEE